MKDCKNCIFYDENSVTECKLIYEQTILAKEKFNITVCEIDNNDTDKIKVILGQI